MAGIIETLLDEAKKFGHWKWIVISLLAVVLTVFAVFSQLADNTKEAIVRAIVGGESTTEAAVFPGVEILEKKTSVDLSEWTPGGQPKDGKAVFTTVYTVRKVREDTKCFGRLVGTSGTKPEVHSDTHDIELRKVKEECKGGLLIDRYYVYIDIEDAEPDSVFECRLRSIRYGGFKDKNANWCATAFRQSTRKGHLQVKFPPDKPGRNFRFSRYPVLDFAHPKPIQPDSANTDTPGYLFWTIAHPFLGYAYRVDWEWEHEFHTFQ